VEAHRRKRHDDLRAWLFIHPDDGAPQDYAGRSNLGSFYPAGRW
jgi:hypothetical protein